ncbi:lysine/ornithine N-monooxygenase [Cylindrobasidium torrendii FP15055 ss-10]|uniref:L-ornithine N(5)-monooxygenase [NAD(P)H] n=1 Tax=Cylindrobasidium torrendii FP15055 ss-10 TaxID=1314674 RepID=A0A0D7BPR4_9AGAR|nr:lysine/ornithine N-monooxygenase [Cylindrobasidium torrendii FP15055 ss-10]
MQSADEIYDLLGVGFGPANVAIAGAVVEAWQTNAPCAIKRALFLEQRPTFQWHPGMLLPGARMQISFLKDLATLGSPRSPITFLSYLHSQDRLINFINRGDMIPTRREFADYLSWAAGYVEEQGVNVSYNSEVVGIDQGPDGIVSVTYKHATSGELSTRRTRNLVISPGGTGKVPHPFSAVSHPLMIHSASYLMSIDSIFSAITAKGRPHLRLAVIGGGQSAAEVALNLRDRLSNVPTTDGPHEIDIIIRKGALRPSDDTGFANEVFDPASTDAWYTIASPAARLARVREYKSTNYSVVNPLTLATLYEIAYAQKVDSDIARRTKATISQSTPLIHIRPYSDVISVEAPTQEADDFVFNIQNPLSREINMEKYDAVFTATGYQRTAWIDLLKHSTVGKAFNLSPECQAETCRLAPEHESDDVIPVSYDTPLSISSSVSNTPPTSPSLSMTLERPHKLRITRGYRLLPSEENTSLKSRVYLQGMEEATHGLSDTLLSVLGIRAKEVLADLNKD